MGKWNEVSCAIVLSANSLLFFLRARAIFNRNPYLVLCFFLLWLTVVGTAITPALPTVITSGKIGTTDYCTNVAAKSYGGLFTVPPVINDTVIFLAISWRMFASSHTDNGLKGNLKAFVSGEYLPRFSKAVLKDGQLYYLYVYLPSGSFAAHHDPQHHRRRKYSRRCHDIPEQFGAPISHNVLRVHCDDHQLHGVPRLQEYQVWIPPARRNNVRAQLARLGDYADVPLPCHSTGTAHRYTNCPASQYYDCHGNNG